ncbi:uncharacterized protein [Cherax quadricarinatus]
MKQRVLCFLLGVVLPIVSSLVTYSFISFGVKPIPVDETGALICMIILIKLVLLWTQGIFPIDLNGVLFSIYERRERSINGSTINDRHSLYQVPDVEDMPCIRRFLCEMETAAKTSDNYLPKEPAVVNDRILEEEVAPEEVDPLTEMQVEAVRALYREEDPTGELSERGRRALGVVEGLTGKSCEVAYRLCPGRFTTSLIYRAIFDEINVVIKDEDN